MLGKRGKMDEGKGLVLLDDSSNGDKLKMVIKMLLRNENMKNEETFLLKYYVDYEYPRTQVYLKEFWKRTLNLLNSDVFNSSCGKPTLLLFITILFLQL
jgi:hypothetical protein